MIYTCPSFSIEIPDATRDASTYSFVIPVQERFHPSVVIRREPLPAQTTFAEYAAAQLSKMEAELKNFRLLSGPESSAGRVAITYEWGEENDARLHQTQIYIDRGQSYYLLTMTQLSGSRIDYRPVFARIVGTFKPNL